MKFTQNHFLASSSIVLAGSLGTNIINYVFNLVMGRLLTPAEYGAVVALVTLTVFIGAPAGAVTLLLAKRTAELTAHNDAQGILNLVQFTKKSGWLIGIVLTMVALAISPWLAYFFHTPAVHFILLSLIIIPTLLGATSTGALQGLQFFSTLSVVRIIPAVGKLVFSIALVILGYSIAGVITAVVMGSSLSVVYAFYKLNRYLNKPGIVTLVKTDSKLETIHHAPKKDYLFPPSPYSSDKSYDPPSSRRVGTTDRNSRTFFSIYFSNIILGARHIKKIVSSLSSSFYIVFIATILIAVFMGIDVVLAKHFLSAHMAGEYSSLAILGRIIIYGATAITTVMLPMAAASKGAHTQQTKKLLMQSVFFVGGASALGVAVFFLAPTFIITILFGAAYLSVAPYLGVFGLAMLMGAISMVFVHYFIAMHNKLFVYPFAFATIVLVVLLWLFHGTVRQMTYNQLIANAVLLAGMAATYVHSVKSCQSLK